MAFPSSETATTGSFLVRPNQHGISGLLRSVASLWGGHGTRLVLVAATLAVCQTAWTQSPTYSLGRNPTAEEIRAWDISISPDGKELPPGHGTAKEGTALYVRKGCAGCHGPTGYSAGHAPTLIRRKDPPPRRVRSSCALSCSLCERLQHHGDSLPFRDHDMGLHQSWHAARQRGDAYPR